jgi:hypothetical protein
MEQVFFDFNDRVDVVGFIQSGTQVEIDEKRS